MHYVTFFVYAEHLPPVQLVVLLSWANYNFKSFKLNKSASPFRKKSFYLFDPANMAKPRTCQSPRRNSLHTSKDKLVDDASRASTNNSGTSTPIFAMSCSSTPAMSRTPTPTSAPASLFNSKLFELFIKTYLGAQTQPALSKAEEKALNRPLKAMNPDLYYDNLHIKYYYVYCQYEDHFETAGAKGHKRILFATLFIWKKINFRWQQHKTWIKHDIIGLTWQLGWTWDAQRGWIT